MDNKWTNDKLLAHLRLRGAIMELEFAATSFPQDDPRRELIEVLVEELQEIYEMETRLDN